MRMVATRMGAVLLALLVLIGLISCAPPRSWVRSPQPPATRPPTAVSAPVDRTWDTVIEQFAALNIPISVMERSSGLIRAEPLNLPGTRGWVTDARFPEPSPYADCGGIDFGDQQNPTRREYYHPDRATYNVLVRG